MNWQADHEARIAAFPEAIRNAHRHSSQHRAELLESEKCGCFYCQQIYSPSEITDWTDSDATGQGQTALCAKCGIDSVIGDRSGFPITPDFLAEMNRHWF
jgi:hypothetical protein